MKKVRGKFVNECDFQEGVTECDSGKRYKGKCGKPGGKVSFNKKTNRWVRRAKNRCKAKPYVRKGRGGKYLGKGVRW